MRFFKVRPFKFHKREALTVGALRAKAARRQGGYDSEVISVVRVPWPKAKYRGRSHPAI